MVDREYNPPKSVFERQCYRLVPRYQGQIPYERGFSASHNNYKKDLSHEGCEFPVYDDPFMMTVPPSGVASKLRFTVGYEGQEKPLPTQTTQTLNEHCFVHQFHDKKIEGPRKTDHPSSEHQEGFKRKLESEKNSDDRRRLADMMLDNTWVKVGCMEEEENVVTFDEHIAEEEKQYDAEQEEDVDSEDSKDTQKDLEKYTSKEPVSDDFEKVTLEKSDDLTEIHAHSSKTFAWSFRRMAHRVIQVLDTLKIQSSDKATYNLMIRLLCKPITLPDVLRSQWHEIVSRRLECHLVRQEMLGDAQNMALTTLKLRLRKKLSEFVDGFSSDDDEDFVDDADDDEASADGESCMDWLQDSHHSRRRVEKLKLWTHAEEKMMSRLQWNFHNDRMILCKTPEMEELEEDLMDFADMLRVSQSEAAVRSATGTKPEEGNNQKNKTETEGGNFQETGTKPEAGNYQDIGTKSEVGNIQEIGTKSEAGNYQETGTKSEVGNTQETGTKSEIENYQDIGTKSEVGNTQETGTKSEVGNYQDIGEKSEVRNIQETGTKFEVGNIQETGTKSEAGNYQETGTKSEAGNYQETRTDSVTASLQTSTRGSSSVPSQPTPSCEKDDNYHWRKMTEVFDVNYMTDRFQAAREMAYSERRGVGERSPRVTLSHWLFTHLVLQEPDLDIRQKTLLLWIGGDHGDQQLNQVFWNSVIEVLRHHKRNRRQRSVQKTPQSSGKEPHKTPPEGQEKMPERQSEASVGALMADLTSAMMKQVSHLLEGGNCFVHPNVLDELDMEKDGHMRERCQQPFQREAVMLVPLSEAEETMALTSKGFRTIQLLELSEQMKEQVKTVLTLADVAYVREETRPDAEGTHPDLSSDQQPYYGIEVPDAMVRMLANMQQRVAAAQGRSSTPAIPDLALVWTFVKEPFGDDQKSHRLSRTGSQLEVVIPLRTDDCTEWMFERLARVLVHMEYVDVQLRMELLASVLTCRNYAERNVFLKFLTQNLETCACQAADEMNRLGLAAFQQGTIDMTFLDKLCQRITQLCQQLLNYSQLVQLSICKDDTDHKHQHVSLTADDRNPAPRTEEDSEQDSQSFTERHGEFQSVTRSSQMGPFLMESERTRVKELLKDVLNDWFVTLVHKDSDDELAEEKCKTQMKDRLIQILEISGRDVSTIYDVAHSKVTESESESTEQPDASVDLQVQREGSPLDGSAEEQEKESQRNAGTQTAIEPRALYSNQDLTEKVLTLEERLVSIQRLPAVLALPEMCALSLRTEAEDGCQRPLHLEHFKDFVNHVLKDFYIVHPRALHEVLCASVLLAEDFCDESKELITSTLNRYCRKILSVMVYCATTQSPQPQQHPPEVNNSRWIESQDIGPRILDID